MEFKKIDTATMAVKEGNGRQTGISAHVRSLLEMIPEGEAVTMAEVAKALVEDKKVKDTHQAYIRINNALKTDDGQLNYERMVNSVDNYTYIARKKKETIEVESTDIPDEEKESDGDNEEQQENRE